MLATLTSYSELNIYYSEFWLETKSGEKEMMMIVMRLHIIVVPSGTESGPTGGRSPNS